MSIKINNGSTKPDSICFVEFLVENVTDLFGISFEMLYTPTTYIESITVEEGSWLGSDILFYPTVDLSAGKVSFGISKKAGQDAVSGSGVVAKLSMKMKNIDPIETNLTLQNIVANDHLGNTIQIEASDYILTEVAARKFAVPEKHKLFQNYPNPFNPETYIDYQLSTKAHVKLDIFNLQGQKIRTLKNQQQDAGYYTVLWDGFDDFGNRVVSGIYLYRIMTEDFESMKKMVVIK